MIYIDNTFHCHVENPNGTFRGFDVPYFYDKCKTFIEGYMYIPPGEACTLEDGVKLRGELIAPWKPYDELDAAQRQYELDMAEAAAAYQEGVDSAYEQ